MQTAQCLNDNSIVKELLNTTSNNSSVLVVDGGGSFSHALLGDQIALNASANNWSGVVINGCVRDSVALGSMESIGVMALGSVPRKTVKRGVGSKEIGLSIWGVVIEPGDYLVADEDGIVLFQRRNFEFNTSTSNQD